MKNVFTKAALAVCALGLSVQAFAGNKDRTGQAGATELLVNPWGLSNGVFAQNGAYVRGVEAMKTNIAGLALAERTELALGYSQYLRGSGVGVNNLGFAQRLGEAGVLGINLMTMSFGDITVTDYNNPQGGIGTYKPQFFNVSAGFAKSFSRFVHAGVGVTFVSEQISNVRASGAAFEAGVQYVTGARDNFHFGVTLRNVGTNMRFAGEGFNLNSPAPAGGLYEVDRQTPSERFEMPTYLSLAASYDFYLDEGRLRSADSTPQHRLTVMGSFTSNSFNNDYLGGGVEYAFRESFMLRAAYRHESKIMDDALSTTFYTGISAGATAQTSLGKDGPLLAIDYAYRPTVRPANGVHTFSLRFRRR